MLKEARKFLAYANIRAKILDNENMDFTEQCCLVTGYSYELMDILEWYNETAEKTPMSSFEALCDEVLSATNSKQCLHQKA